MSDEPADAPILIDENGTLTDQHGKPLTVPTEPTLVGTIVSYDPSMTFGYIETVIGEEWMIAPPGIELPSAVTAMTGSGRMLVLVRHYRSSQGVRSAPVPMSALKTWEPAS